jgi:cellulose synthase operon protein C
MTCSSNTICTPEPRRPRRAWLLAGAALALGLTVSSAAQIPDRAAQYRALAAQALVQGDIGGAANALNRALAVTPLDADLWVDIARFRYRGGEHLLAMAAAERALSFGPDNAAALRLKAELVRDSEGMVPSLVWFERALARAPDDLSLKAEYAATLGEAGRAADMLAVTREILENDPNHARAFYLQAVLAARAGNFGLAKRLLDRDADRLGNLPAALLLRGVVEIDAQNYTLALESLEPLYERQPGNRRVRDLLAKAKFLSGDYAGLVERFGEAAARGDGSAYLTMTVARAYEQLGQRDLAAPLLDKMVRGGFRPVLAIAGKYPVGRMLAAGETGSARMQVGGWLSANPGNFDHLALAGDVELVAGNAGAASRYYERAARIRNPESLTLRRVQARLLAGDVRGATALAERKLAATPGSVPIRHVAGLLAAGTGDWDRARTLLAGVAEASQGRDVQVLSDLAVVETKAGDAEAGVASARRALGVYRAYPAGAQALGLALAAQGSEPQTAAAALAKARAMLGDNALLIEARTALAAQGRPE